MEITTLQIVLVFIVSVPPPSGGLYVDWRRSR